MEIIQNMEEKNNATQTQYTEAIQETEAPRDAEDVSIASRSPSTGNMRMITIPLITQPWERDVLYKRMELCRSLYNAELGRVEHRYHAMQHDARYRHYRDVIDSVYEQDAKSRAKAKQAPEYKAATRLQNDLFKEYGFTSYTFHSRAIEISRPYKELLPTRVAHFTIGIPMWQAVHGILLGDQTGFCYKSPGDVHTLSSDGRSGIRLLTPEGRSARDGVDIRGLEQAGFIIDEWTHAHRDVPLSVAYSKGKGRRGIRLALRLDLRDDYIVSALRQPLHVLRIVRKEHHGKDRYFVQLTIDAPELIKNI